MMLWQKINPFVSQFIWDFFHLRQRMNGKGKRKQYKRKDITIREREILPIDKYTFQIGGKPEATSSNKLLDTCECSYTFSLQKQV